jgi:hypothetical protein
MMRRRRRQLQAARNPANSPIVGSKSPKIAYHVSERSHQAPRCGSLAQARSLLAVAVTPNRLQALRFIIATVHTTESTRSVRTRSVRTEASAPKRPHPRRPHPTTWTSRTGDSNHSLNHVGPRHPAPPPRHQRHQAHHHATSCSYPKTIRSYNEHWAKLSGVLITYLWNLRDPALFYFND